MFPNQTPGGIGSSTIPFVPMIPLNSPSASPASSHFLNAAAAAAAAAAMSAAVPAATRPTATNYLQSVIPPPVFVDQSVPPRPVMTTASSLPMNFVPVPIDQLLSMRQSAVFGSKKLGRPMKEAPKKPRKPSKKDRQTAAAAAAAALPPVPVPSFASSSVPDAPSILPSSSSSSSSSSKSKPKPKSKKSSEVLISLDSDDDDSSGSDSPRLPSSSSISIPMPPSLPASPQLGPNISFLSPSSLPEPHPDPMGLSEIVALPAPAATLPALPALPAPVPASSSSSAPPPEDPSTAKQPKKRGTYKKHKPSKAAAAAAAAAAAVAAAAAANSSADEVSAAPPPPPPAVPAAEDGSTPPVSEGPDVVALPSSTSAPTSGDESPAAAVLDVSPYARYHANSSRSIKGFDANSNSFTFSIEELENEISEIQKKPGRHRKIVVSVAAVVWSLFCQDHRPQAIQSKGLSPTDPGLDAIVDPILSDEYIALAIAEKWDYIETAAERLSRPLTRVEAAQAILLTTRECHQRKAAIAAAAKAAAIAAEAALNPKPVAKSGPKPKPKQVEVVLPTLPVVYTGPPPISLSSGLASLPQSLAMAAAAAASAAQEASSSSSSTSFDSIMSTITLDVQPQQQQDENDEEMDDSIAGVGLRITPPPPAAAAASSSSSAAAPSASPAIIPSTTAIPFARFPSATPFSIRSLVPVLFAKTAMYKAGTAPIFGHAPSKDNIMSRRLEAGSKLKKFGMTRRRMEMLGIDPSEVTAAKTEASAAAAAPAAKRGRKRKNARAAPPTSAEIAEAEAEHAAAELAGGASTTTEAAAKPTRPKKRVRLRTAQDVALEQALAGSVEAEQQQPQQVYSTAALIQELKTIQVSLQEEDAEYESIKSELTSLPAESIAALTEEQTREFAEYSEQVEAHLQTVKDLQVALQAALDQGDYSDDVMSFFRTCMEQLRDNNNLANSNTQ